MKFARYGNYIRPENDLTASWFGVGLGLRLGQKINLDYELSYNTEENDYGYVSRNEVEDSIHFSRRDLHTIENVLTMDYTLNNKLSLRLRGRHYYSTVENKDFYLLQEDGDLKPNDEFEKLSKKLYDVLPDIHYSCIFLGKRSKLSFSRAHGCETIVLYN